MSILGGDSWKNDNLYFLVTEHDQYNQSLNVINCFISLQAKKCLEYYQNDALRYHILMETGITNL